MKTLIIPVLMGALAATLIALPAEAGPKKEYRDALRFQMDIQEDGLDQLHDNGRWDRREDRADRRLNKRERQGKRNPAFAQKRERRSFQRQINTGYYMNGGVIDRHAGTTYIQPQTRPKGNGRINGWLADRETGRSGTRRGGGFGGGSGGGATTIDRR